jgi:hypothetical protein
MGLRLKFNLVLIVVFLAGFGAAGYMSRQLLQENAREEVLRNARLMMDTALSVRAYTVEQIKPHLDKQLRKSSCPRPCRPTRPPKRWATSRRNTAITATRKRR